MPPVFRKPEKKAIKVLVVINGGDITKLDISRKYELQDKSENFWRFTFEAIAGEEGWFAWIKRPNSEEYFCIGKIAESELLKRIQSSPPPLTPDDLIDLELWLIHGGLDTLKPKKRIRKPKQEVTE